MSGPVCQGICSAPDRAFDRIERLCQHVRMREHYLDEDWGIRVEQLPDGGLMLHRVAGHIGGRLSVPLEGLGALYTALSGMTRTAFVVYEDDEGYTMSGRNGGRVVLPRAVADDFAADLDARIAAYTLRLRAPTLLEGLDEQLHRPRRG